MMTRKHFIAIAKILKKHNINEMKVYVIMDLCDYFESENPNFDREKFVKACYGGYPNGP